MSETERHSDWPGIAIGILAVLVLIVVCSAVWWAIRPHMGGFNVVHIENVDPPMDSDEQSEED